MKSNLNTVVALQKYAIDCINSDLLDDAISAIKQSISRLPSGDSDEIDRTVIGLLNGDNRG